MQIKGMVRMFKDRFEYGIYEFCSSSCHVWTYTAYALKKPAATAAGGTQEEQRKLNHEKLLQWSWTRWQISNPTQNSASPTAAASSLLSPILIRRGVCTPPYQSPRAHKHICLLFIQPLLFSSAHPHSRRNIPLHFHRSPAHHFQIRCIHRRTRWRA